MKKTKVNSGLKGLIKFKNARLGLALDRNSEGLGSNFTRGCTYTMLQTVQRCGVSSTDYGTETVPAWSHGAEIPVS